MSTLIISKRRKDGVMILDLSGGIKLGEENAYLHNTIKDLVAAGSMAARREEIRSEERGEGTQCECKCRSRREPYQ
jgi:hypothetical protein